MSTTAVRPGGLALIQPSRMPGYKPTYYRRTSGHANNDSVVSTAALREALMPLVEELEADITGGSEYIRHNTSVWETLAAKIEPLLVDPVSLDSITKAIRNIRNLTTRATTARFGDAALMALGSSLRDKEIPELPGGKAAALERIDAYCELRGRELSQTDRDGLAGDLLEFSMLMLHGLEPWYGLRIDWDAANAALEEHLDGADVQLALEAA